MKASPDNNLTPLSLNDLLHIPAASLLLVNYLVIPLQAIIKSPNSAFKGIIQLPTSVVVIAKFVRFHREGTVAFSEVVKDFG